MNGYFPYPTHLLVIFKFKMNGYMNGYFKIIQGMDKKVS